MDENQTVPEGSEQAAQTSQTPPESAPVTENSNMPTVAPEHHQDLPVAVVPAADSSNIETSMPQARKMSKLAMIIAGAVVVLAGGAYAAYASYYSPSMVWKRFSDKPKQVQVASEWFNVTYEDQGQASGEALKDPSLAVFNNVKLNFNGNAFVNMQNVSNSEMSLDANYSFGGSGVTLSSKVKMIMKGQDFYLNPGENALIKSIMAAISPDKEVSWLKFNFKELGDLQNSQAAPSQQVDFEKLTKEYQEIAQKYSNKIIKQGKYINKETVRGIQTVHYASELDKAQLKAMAQEVVNKMIEQWTAQGLMKAEEAGQAKTISTKVVNDLIDRAQIKTLETWVGMKDNQLHKVKVVTTVPSFVSFLSLAVNQGNYLDAQTDPEKVADIALKGINFDALFTMEQEIYDIGKVVPVTPPTDFVDVAKLVKEQQQAQEQISQPVKKR